MNADNRMITEHAIARSLHHQIPSQQSVARRKHRGFLRSHEHRSYLTAGRLCVPFVAAASLAFRRCAHSGLDDGSGDAPALLYRQIVVVLSEA